MIGLRDIWLASDEETNYVLITVAAVTITITIVRDILIVNSAKTFDWRIDRKTGSTRRRETMPVNKIERAGDFNVGRCLWEKEK